MAKKTIWCKGAKLMGYVEFIEKIFTGHGICLERINMDFIEIRLKRHYPVSYTHLTLPTILLV